MRFLGTIAQIGYVTRDVRRSIDFYVDVMGIGPWFLLENVSFPATTYRGAPARGRYAIALANSGDMQLELIQPLDDEPSIYREWLLGSSRNEIMHHVSTWVEDYDRCVAEARAAGCSFVIEGGNERGGFCYLEHPRNPGALIELSELSPARRRVWEAVAAAARGWDGTDPVRLGWPGL